MEEVVVDIKTERKVDDKGGGNITVSVNLQQNNEGSGESSNDCSNVKEEKNRLMQCRYFEKHGECTKEDCKFLHEKKKCTYFESRMGCRDGDECLLQHYRGEADASIEEGPDEYENNGLCEGKQLIAEVEKLNLLESDNKRSRDKSKIVCRFMKKGKCIKEDCPYSHELKNRPGKTPNHPTEESQHNVESDTSPFNMKEKDSTADSGNSPNSDQNTEQVVLQKQNTVDENKSREICRYFNSRKGCYTGHKCPNLHERRGQQEYSVQENSEETEMLRNVRSDHEKAPRTSKRKCRFFNTAKGCRDGENCPYVHTKFISKKSNVVDNQEFPNSSENLDSGSALKTGKGNKAPIVCRFYHTKQGCFNGEKCLNLHEKVASKNNEPIVKSSVELRATELKQLEKRWKGHFECKQTEPTAVYHVKISPTDPDWPFVVKEFVVQVEFPKDYPEKMFAVVLQENENYPPYFCGFMNEILDSWCDIRNEQRDEKDLAFRPFCKWFDKELKSNFEFAANKVKLQLEANAFGIQLIHHNSILPRHPASEETESGDDVTVEEEDSIDDTANGSSAAANELFVSDDKESHDDSKCSSNVKKGTEVKLQNLQLNEAVGTLRIRSALLVVQCERCKTKHDYDVFTKQKAKASCKKCHQEHSVVYHSELMHQYSPVAGYLHLANCKAFDFILNDSAVVVSCFECNKDNAMKGLLTGSKKEHWCQHCHTKIEIRIQYVKFNQLQPSGAVITNNKASKDSHEETKKKIPKEPGIKEGQPLPDNGSCKHYKKSYRWLRFPCCGKAYACDICHDDGVNNEHVMKIANKMICGFCSKEQPFFRDKPCVSCKQGVIKGRSTHWEGGKGCRDKSKMARGDKHKTQGQGKTISRKKDEVSHKKK